MGHTAEVPLTETVCFYHSGKIGFSTHPSDSVNLSINPSLKSVIFPRHGAARLALKLGVPDVDQSTWDAVMCTSILARSPTYAMNMKRVCTTNRVKLTRPESVALARSVRFWLGASSAPHAGTCFRYPSRFCIRSSFFDCERVASASARSATRVSRCIGYILL